MESQQNQVKLLGDYKIVAQLGKGSFGTVYKAAKSHNQLKNEQERFYAIKVQNVGTVKPMLHLQAEILQQLKQKQLQQKQNQKGIMIPEVFLFKQEQYFSYMVMDLLDITLEDFANKVMKNIISKDCLIRIFYNILKIVEDLHQLGYTHRDIKPANFMLKRKKCESNDQNGQKFEYQPTIYPIDLGLCKNYMNPLTRQHILEKKNKKMVGTAIFCSLNTHEGFQQARRDDLESIIYLVTYLVKKLPWEAVANKQAIFKKEKMEKQIESPRKITNMKEKLDTYEQIYQIKKSTDFDKFLKDSQLLPNCFIEIFNYVRKLNFPQQPDYRLIYGLLEKEHLQLTGSQLKSLNFECRWENLCLNNSNHPQPTKQNQKKKIKINFKIPTNKIKKPPIQKPDFNQSQTLTL